MHSYALLGVVSHSAGSEAVIGETSPRIDVVLHPSRNGVEDNVGQGPLWAAASGHRH